MEGLARLLLDLGAAGCTQASLDGSFVTREKWPGDFDVCYEPQGMDASRLTPELRDFSSRSGTEAPLRRRGPIGDRAVSL